MKKVIKILLFSVYAILNFTGCAQKDTAIKADMSQYGGLTDTDHVFVESSIEDFLQKSSNGDTFVAFFGQTTCYWCNEVIRILNDTAKEYSDKILYIDVTTPNEEEYHSIVDSIKEYLDYGLDGEKHLYTPEVIFIRNGNTIMTANCISKEDEEGNLILDEEKQKERYIEGFESLELRKQ